MEDYLSAIEFDAYSKEITEIIKTAYKGEDNKEMIRRWISSKSFYYEIEESMEIVFILNISFFYLEVISYWGKNNSKYIRKLRQRLYNEVLNESSS